MLRRMRRPGGSSTPRTMTSTSAPTGSALETSPSLATPVSLIGTRPVPIRRKEHEHAELLVTLDFPVEARARHDLGLR